MFNVIDVDWPAASVPVQMGQTWTERTWDGESEEAYMAADSPPVPAD